MKLEMMLSLLGITPEQVQEMGGAFQAISNAAGKIDNLVAELRAHGERLDAITARLEAMTPKEIDDGK